MAIHGSILRRFMSKVDVRSDNECWPWVGGISQDGYGNFNLNGHTVRAHRVSYFLRHGELPLRNDEGEELLVCHHCDNSSCCNPDHLFLGTSKDNVQDCIRKNRRADQQGERNPNVKLTDDQVIQVRLMLFKGIDQDTIASYFRVSSSLISLIGSGKRRKHLRRKNVK